MSKNKKSLFTSCLVVLIMLVIALVMLPQSVSAATRTKIKFAKSTITTVAGFEVNAVVKGIPISQVENIKYSISNKGSEDEDDLVTGTSVFAVRYKSFTPGTHTIELAYKGKTYKCKVVVKPVIATYKIGTRSARKSCNLTYSDCTTVSLLMNTTGKTSKGSLKVSNLYGTKVKGYVSTNTSVVSIDNRGNMKAVGAGTATVYCVLSKGYDTIIPIKLSITVKGTNTNVSDDIKTTVKKGYTASNRITKGYFKTLNSMRKKHGNRTVSANSKLNYAAGHILYTHGKTTSEMTEWLHASGNSSSREATDIARMYGYSGNVLVIYTRNSYEFADIEGWLSHYLRDRLLSSRNVGMYSVAGKGTVILIGEV